MKNQNVTIEDLAGMVKKGFDGMDKKFDAKFDTALDAIGEKFDAIDKKFDAIDEKFDAISKRFDAIDEKFDSINEKFEAMDGKIEKGFQEVNVRFNRLENFILKQHSQKIEILEKRIKHLEEVSATK